MALVSWSDFVPLSIYFPHILLWFFLFPGGCSCCDPGGGKPQGFRFLGVGSSISVGYTLCFLATASGGFGWGLEGRAFCVLALSICGDAKSNLPSWIRPKHFGMERLRNPHISTAVARSWSRVGLPRFSCLSDVFPLSLWDCYYWWSIVRFGLVCAVYC